MNHLVFPLIMDYNGIIGKAKLFVDGILTCPKPINYPRITSQFSSVYFSYNNNLY